MTEQNETSKRAMQAAERLMEDEGLTGDLPDEPAKALLQWAIERARSVALNQGLDDGKVSEQIGAIRRAVIGAASVGGDAPSVVEAAQRALAAVQSNAAAEQNSGEPAAVAQSQQLPADLLADPAVRAALFAEPVPDTQASEPEAQHSTPAAPRAPTGETSQQEGA